MLSFLHLADSWKRSSHSRSVAEAPWAGVQLKVESHPGAPSWHNANPTVQCTSPSHSSHAGHESGGKKWLGPVKQPVVTTRESICLNQTVQQINTLKFMLEQLNHCSKWKRRRLGKAKKEKMKSSEKSDTVHLKWGAFRAWSGGDLPKGHSPAEQCLQGPEQRCLQLLRRLLPKVGQAVLYGAVRVRGAEHGRGVAVEAHAGEGWRSKRSTLMNEQVRRCAVSPGDCYADYWEPQQRVSHWKMSDNC